MTWNNDRSVKLSQAGIILFAILLAAADIGGVWIVRTYTELRHMEKTAACVMTVALYVSSVFGWIFLVHMWKLLKNVKNCEVFTEANVNHLRAVSWCCLAAAVTFLASSAVWLPFLIVAVTAGYMALIVRVVKNSFAQATAMKSELDLTI